MNPEDVSWAEEAEPSDDDRVLHGGSPRGQGSGTIDYGEAVTAQDAAWWAALSDYEYTYGILRALEQASGRGAPLHRVRCVHHLQDLLRGLNAADRAWLLVLVERMRAWLARCTGTDDTAVTLADLLAYLAGVDTDPRFAPPSVLPVGLLHGMFPHGVTPRDLHEALDRQRYPHGKPFPVCPVCEMAPADPDDALTKAVGALSRAQRLLLVHLGQALALAENAPDLWEQLAWVTGARPVPAPYHAALARQRRGDTDTSAPSVEAT